MRGNQLPVSANRWQHGSQIHFWNLYFLNNHKIAKNSTTTKAREKISTDFYVCLTVFKNNQILLNKISH